MKYFKDSKARDKCSIQIREMSVFLNYRDLDRKQGPLDFEWFDRKILPGLTDDSKEQDFWV